MWQFLPSGGGSFFLFRDINKTVTDEISLPVKHLIIGLLVITLWAYSCSYFFYQTYDMHFRNAMFRDLCEYDWPIRYPKTGNSMCYYFMQKIVPALFGKAFGFVAGNAALLVWNVIGMFLAYVGICVVLRPRKNRDLWIILLVYVTFEGLNEVGRVLADVMGKGAYSLGGSYTWVDLFKGYGYMYVPNESAIAWFYHETIVPWIAVCLFLAAPQLKYFAILGLCVLPYAPFAFVGLVVFFAVGFFLVVRKEGIWPAVKQCLSIPNICAVLSIFPVFFLFFRQNVSARIIGFYEVRDAFGPGHILYLCTFYFLEFGLYCLIIGRDYKKSPLFWSMLAMLLLFPHIKVGTSRDFVVRAAIPALFVLMLMVICYLLNNCEKAPYSFATVVLIGCISLCIFDISKDWAVRIRDVKNNGWRPLVANNIGTFSDKELNDAYYMGNALVPDPDNTAFFKYIGKK